MVKHIVGLLLCCLTIESNAVQPLSDNELGMMTGSDIKTLRVMQTVRCPQDMNKDDCHQLTMNQAVQDKQVQTAYQQVLHDQTDAPSVVQQSLFTPPTAMPRQEQRSEPLPDATQMLQRLEQLLSVTK